MEKATHGSPGVWKATLSNSVSVLAIGECLFPFSHELLKVYFQPWNTATCLWPWCSLLTFPKERAATVVILLGSRRLTSVAGSQLRWAGTVLPKQSPVYVAPSVCARTLDSWPTLPKVQLQSWCSWHDCYSCCFCWPGQCFDLYNQRDVCKQIWHMFLKHRRKLSFQWSSSGWLKRVKQLDVFDYALSLRQLEEVQAGKRNEMLMK